jgi:hypothetical protein
VPAFIEKNGGGSFTGIFSGSLANKQINSLMVNMQRTFAETVSSVVTDVQVGDMRAVHASASAYILKWKKQKLEH